MWIQFIDFDRIRTDGGVKWRPSRDQLRIGMRIVQILEWKWHIESDKSKLKALCLLEYLEGD